MVNPAIDARVSIFRRGPVKCLTIQSGETGAKDTRADGILTEAVIYRPVI